MCTAFWKALTAVAASLLFSITASATTLVPGGFANFEGLVNNNFPFTFGAARYQQIYAASAFSGPVEISSIAFRLNRFIGGAQSFIYDDLSISLSTAQTTVGTASTTFANNIGLDVVNVLSVNGSANQSLVGDGEPLQDFDLIFNFSTSFEYDPTLGDLLFELTKTGGTADAPLDAAYSSAFTRISANGSPDATSGDIDTGNFGLITQFGLTPTIVTPIPASLPLFGTGLAVLGFISWRRKRKAS